MMMLKTLILSSFLLIPGVWAQSQDTRGLASVVEVLNPSFNGPGLVKSMDSLMRNQECSQETVKAECPVIPNELADMLKATDGMIVIEGTPSTRACGNLVLRPGFDLSEYTSANPDMYEDGKVIYVTDPNRGNVKVSLNKFGLGMKFKASDSSTINFGIGNKGRAGVKLKQQF